MQEGKVVTEETLQIAEERREAKVKKKRKIYPTECRVPENSKEIRPSSINNAKKQGKNDRMGKTRDLFKKTGDIKGTFHAEMDAVQDRNSKNLTEVEEIKKRWQEYTELYK